MHFELTLQDYDRSPRKEFLCRNLTYAFLYGPRTASWIAACFLRISLFTRGRMSGAGGCFTMIGYAASAFSLWRERLYSQKNNTDTGISGRVSIASTRKVSLVVMWTSLTRLPRPDPRLAPRLRAERMNLRLAAKKPSIISIPSH
jgi:hypothetical protein